MQQKWFSTLIMRIIIYNWALIIIDNKSAGNKYIRMISEGSCDTEDCSNDAENQLWSQ